MGDGVGAGVVVGGGGGAVEKVGNPTTKTGGTTGNPNANAALTNVVLVRSGTDDCVTLSSGKVMLTMSSSASWERRLMMELRMVTTSTRVASGATRTIAALKASDLLEVNADAVVANQ